MLSIPREYLTLFGTVLMGSVGQILVKTGASKLGAEPLGEGVLQFILSAAMNPYIVGGIACWALSTTLWVLTLNRVDLSYAYPALSFGYVIVFLSSWLILEETLTLQRMAGVVLILAGIFVVLRS
jgi:multidrug transporter EmrE-like cation transporter